MVKAMLCTSALLLLFLLTACQPIQPVPEGETTVARSSDTELEAANRAVATRVYEEIMNQRNLSAIGEVFAPDVIAHQPEFDPEGLTDLGAFVMALPDLHVTVEKMMAEGEMVMSLVTFSGTHQAEFMGIAPSGNPVTFRLIDLLRIHDGKIVEVWNNVPLRYILAQMEKGPDSTTGPTTVAVSLDPVETVKAFYAAMNGLEYEKAVTFLADDVIIINPGGTFTGTAENLAQLTAAWESGIRLEVSILRNIDGIVVYHNKVTENGTILYDGEGGITIVEDGKITFDGGTQNRPLAADPTSPIEVVKAFYIALDAKEYDAAMALVADDATITDDGGIHTRVAEVEARIMEAGDAGRTYDIWDLSEENGTVSYNAKVYQGETVIYETIGSAVVEDGKITMTSTVEQ